MNNSKFFNLNWQDFIKGLIMAVLGSVAGFVMGVINAHSFVFSWPDIWHVALAAFVTYLVKNLFTNSTGQPLSTENK